MSNKSLLKPYLESTEVLIVDKNPSSRNRLLKTMYDIGSKRHLIHTVGSLAEAEQIIATKKIGIVLSDYFISGGSGFELFKMLREKSPDSKELCLILVTSNISQSAVAKAAEEDVDSFIIKPYTVQSIQENLIATLTNKVFPSDYIKMIEEGKSIMKEGDYDRAIEIFTKALELNSKPSLALFYIGQSEYLKMRSHEAQVSYKRGLEVSNIHYKCLVGLFDIFLREEKFTEAYHVVKKIAKYFPANPDRLSQIVRLAVKTANFDDMQMYYEIFTTLDERGMDLKNYIGAGMYIAGKHSLLANSKESALRFFDNVAVSCPEFTKFPRAIISLLIQHDMVDEAEKYLTRFPADSRSDADFLVSDFLVNSRKVEDHNYIVKLGLDLYNKKIRDITCMETLLLSMQKAGYNEEKIAPFKKEMEELMN